MVWFLGVLGVACLGAWVGDADVSEAAKLYGGASVSGAGFRIQLVDHLLGMYL